MTDTAETEADLKAPAERFAAWFEAALPLRTLDTHVDPSGRPHLPEPTGAEIEGQIGADAATAPAANPDTPEARFAEWYRHVYPQPRSMDEALGEPSATPLSTPPAPPQSSTAELARHLGDHTQTAADLAAYLTNPSNR